MSRKAHGQIRRGQVITTYGPGALIDLPRHSAIVGGLDTWPKTSDLEEIPERRLGRKLQLCGCHDFGWMQLERGEHDTVDHHHFGHKQHEQRQRELQRARQSDGDCAHRRREHRRTELQHHASWRALHARAGARVGAICGFFCFGITAILGALRVTILHEGAQVWAEVGQIRADVLKSLQQRAGSYSAQQLQASLDFVRSPTGLVVMLVGLAIFTLILFILMGMLGGAVGGVGMRRRDRSCGSGRLLLALVDRLGRLVGLRQARRFQG